MYHTFATHAGFTYDVTDTDRWAQNGRTHGRVCATFKRRFSTSRTRNRVKNAVCLFFVFYHHDNYDLSG